MSYNIQVLRVHREGYKSSKSVKLKSCISEHVTSISSKKTSQFDCLKVLQTASNSEMRVYS